MFSNVHEKAFNVIYFLQDVAADGSADASFSSFTSDVENHLQSKKASGKGLDKQQMLELENQLVSKIMSHFKTNFNFTPSGSEDIFYSPISETKLIF